MLTGWNIKDAKAFERKRGREEGRKELFALWESGVSLAEAKKRFNPSV